MVSLFFDPNFEMQFNDVYALITHFMPAVEYVEMMFDIVLDPYYNKVGRPYFPEIDGVEVITSFEIWLAASMLDAAVNNTDYSADCGDYRAKWDLLVHFIRADLKRIPPYSNQPMYNRNVIQEKAGKALRYVAGEGCVSDLRNEYARRNREEEFVEAIMTLYNRLKLPQIDPPAPASAQL